jgi:hypothetical protein
MVKRKSPEEPFVWSSYDQVPISLLLVTLPARAPWMMWAHLTKVPVTVEPF